MQYLQYLVIIGAIVNLVGAASYIKETLRGKTKPNRISWLFWTISPLIATAAALVNGVRWAALPVFVSGFGPLLVLLASFVNKKSYWKLEKFDYACGIFSGMALVLWFITKEPTVAIAFAIASDGFAAIPTLIKLWKYPETETANAYVAGLFSSLTSFAAVGIWSFSSVAFPVYLVLINSFLVLAVYKKKIFGR
jgi:hypothetical protein